MDNAADGVVLSWRRLAIAALVVAIASLAGLAVVTAVRDVDVLSTVALSLAILAFLIQIVVFISQTWTTGQQMLQAESLNAQTSSMLAELRTHAQGTQTVLTDQLNTVMKYAFREARVAEKEEGGLTVAQLEKTVRAAMDRAVASTRASATTTGVGSFGVPTLGSSVFSPAEGVNVSGLASDLSDGDRAVLKRLRTYPSEEEGLKLVPILNGLSPLAVTQLRRYADDEITSREVGGAPGLRLRESHPISKELIDAGLVEYSDVEGSENKWGVLTDSGRELVRLLTGSGDVPEWLLRSNG